MESSSSASGLPAPSAYAPPGSSLLGGQAGVTLATLVSAAVMVLPSATAVQAIMSGTACSGDSVV